MAFRSYCGHPMEDKYVRVHVDGNRRLVCRICHRERMQKWRIRVPKELRGPRSDPRIPKPVVWVDLARRAWHAPVVS